MKVFISYARPDEAVAKRLYNDLKRAGVTPWLDSEDLLPGQNWKLTIRQAIKTSNYFLALLSNQSVTRRGAVQKELKMALDLLDEFPQNEIFVIPVKLDDCEPINEKLEHIHWVDLTDYPSGFNRIMRVLKMDVPEMSTPKDLNMQPPQTPKKAIKILFLASNPTNEVRLRLDQEIRAIDEALRKAEFRSQFDIQQHWAVQVSDLQGLIMRHNPDIIHFSGHGSKHSEIILENNQGESQPVPAPALASLFSILKGNIRCVILNACYSEEQAKAISQHIDYVIGMSDAIGDQAAINFSAAFYQAIGYGRDIETAFGLGCVQIHLAGFGEKNTPKLLK